MLAKSLRDEIEACRPGSRDVDDPRMSRLADALAHDPAVRQHYDAVQKLDRRLGVAFTAVAVPAGLADRLLARLGQAPTSAMAVAEPARVSQAPTIHLPGQQAVVRDSKPSGESLRGGRRPFVSRRRLVAALAAAILLGLGTWALRSPSTPTQADVTSEAAGWFSELADAWQPAAKAPADLPMPPAIVGKPTSWQVVSKTIARHGVVYELSQRAGGRAVLFVLSAKRPGLPHSAPVSPQSSTGGLSIGAWQSQGLVYVLVVEGDPRAYRRFVSPGRQPLA